MERRAEVRSLPPALPLQEARRRVNLNLGVVVGRNRRELEPGQRSPLRSRRCRHVRAGGLRGQPQAVERQPRAHGGRQVLAHRRLPRLERDVQERWALGERGQRADADVVRVGAGAPGEPRRRPHVRVHQGLPVHAAAAARRRRARLALPRPLAGADGGRGPAAAARRARGAARGARRAGAAAGGGAAGGPEPRAAALRRRAARERPPGAGAAQARVRGGGLGRAQEQEPRGLRAARPRGARGFPQHGARPRRRAQAAARRRRRAGAAAGAGELPGVRAAAADRRHGVRRDGHVGLRAGLVQPPRAQHGRCAVGRPARRCAARPAPCPQRPLARTF